MIYFEPLLFLISHSVIGLGLIIILLLVSYYYIISKPMHEKNMAYECGFKPFDFAYYPFDIQFYRVGILFLLFDIEIIILFPWLINLYEISYIGHFTIGFFIGLMLLGLIYEVKIGALVWYPYLI